MYEPTPDELRTAEDAEDAAEADVAWDEPGESIPWEALKAEMGTHRLVSEFDAEYPNHLVWSCSCAVVLRIYIPLLSTPGDVESTMAIYHRQAAIQGAHGDFTTEDIDREV
jgi:hypothetical protein